jgi:Transglutaminase-like superfamily
MRLVAALLASAVIAGCDSTATEVAPDLQVSKLPTIGITGKPIAISVTGAKDLFEYRVLMKFPQGDWNLDEPWSATGSLTAVPTMTGALSLDLQVRRPGKTDLLLNKYLGQVSVYDRDETLRLIAWPYDRFRISAVDSGLSRIAAEHGWRGTVTSPKMLAQFVAAHLQTDPSIEAISSSEQARFALSALQIVSGLWHYGNFDNLQAPGCVAINELLSAPKKRLSFGDYLASDIGCCTDYTVILGSTLTAAGIPTRAVTTATHAFDEAYFDGRWWTLDANIGVAYDAPWDQVTDGVTPVNLYSFSHAGMQLGSPIYSDAVSDFRMIVLMNAAAGLMSDFKRTEFEDWVRRTPLIPAD